MYGKTKIDTKRLYHLWARLSIEASTNIEHMIPKDDSVRLLSQIVEELDLGELYQTYSRVRENYATPR